MGVSERLCPILMAATCPLILAGKYILPLPQQPRTSIGVGTGAGSGVSCSSLSQKLWLLPVVLVMEEREYLPSYKGGWVLGLGQARGGESISHPSPGGIRL